MDVRKKAILELVDVRKFYKTKGLFSWGPGKGVLALNRISLKLFKGEIFGLVGESGCGKTTLGRLIVRLEEPDEGTIHLDGLEITGLKGNRLDDFRRKVQMIFQDPYQSLNPQLCAFDTVSEPLTIHHIGNAKTKQTLVRQAMQSVGLSPPDDFFYRYPHQLSGGQRQRVAIARAIVLKPELVIADEPTSMLDASISAQIFSILMEMRERLDITILFITHNLAAARHLCDRIAVIYKGTLVETGPAEAVIYKPRHPYTQALIDALPKYGHEGALKRYGALLRVERQSTGDVGCHFFTRCRRAHRIKCSREIPALEKVDHSHWVACFYQEPGAETNTGSN